MYDASETETTYSLPSPGMWSCTPASIASRRTDLPARLQPASTVNPSLIPRPVTGSPWGTAIVTFRHSSQSKGTASVSGARSSSLLGRTAPVATKATRPISGSIDLMNSALSAV